MLCINSISSDPCFNLATEEYLLKQADKEYFLTYINEPSIIVGKHQNTYAEINFDFIRNNNIKLVRRLTGGGTVFHDFGNLNYSFILNGEEGKLVDFKKHTQPVIDFLGSLSVKAEFGGKNDLLMDGFKISGNAEHVYRKRILHHGTILVESDLSWLSEALKVNPSKYRDKAVRSIRSRVTNISGAFDRQISAAELGELLTRYIINIKGGFEYRLTEQEEENISALADQKFSTWEWNFGYAPKYTFTREFSHRGRTVEVALDVVKGKIENASINGNLVNEKCASAICKAITGYQHRHERLVEAFGQITEPGCLSEINVGEFVSELF